VLDPFRVAVVITCDVAACGAEIERLDAGQPSLAGKKHVYCASCLAYIAAVDQEMATLTTIRSMELANELSALRDAKIAAALPAQKGGAGLQPQWTIEAAQ